MLEAAKSWARRPDSIALTKSWKRAAVASGTVSGVLLVVEAVRHQRESLETRVALRRIGMAELHVCPRRVAAEAGPALLRSDGVSHASPGEVGGLAEEHLGARLPRDEDERREEQQSRPARVLADEGIGALGYLPLFGEQVDRERVGRAPQDGFRFPGQERAHRVEAALRFEVDVDLGMRLLEIGHRVAKPVLFLASSTRRARSPARATGDGRRTRRAMVAGPASSAGVGREPES